MLDKEAEPGAAPAEAPRKAWSAPVITLAAIVEAELAAKGDPDGLMYS